MDRYFVFIWLMALVTIGFAEPSFLERDKDGNGRLTLAESGLTPRLFKQYDGSKNGELSLGEFGKYWTSVTKAPFLKSRAYGSESKRQKLDLYLPAVRQQPMPLVLWIHGGSWKGGDKGSCPFSGLTDRGIAVASLNYRYTTEAPYPAQVNDCAAALRWLRKQEGLLGVEFSQTTAIGLSAGGHLSLLLASDGTVDQAIVFAAPADLTSPAAQLGYRKTLELLVGGPLKNHQQTLRKVSPLYAKLQTGARFYLAHGTADRLVPHNQSELLLKRYSGAGHFVDLTIVPDGSHTLVGGPKMYAKIVKACLSN